MAHAWRTAGTFGSGPDAVLPAGVDAEYIRAWELPALGAVTAPTAVLIRPDGHVAWVEEETKASRGSLTR